jgi:metal-sulfur cluster biosynthetic enzyme
VPDEVLFDLPADCGRPALVARLAQVLDPELDESILDLGFVRSLRLSAGHAEVALQLPTSWCAVNFAYLMAEDVRKALLSLDGIRQVSVGLGDHCAAREIEAAVNAGRSFAEAFPGQGSGSLAALRLNFLRKGFLIRQQRLLQELRAADCAPETICALRLGEIEICDDGFLIRQPGRAPIAGRTAMTLRRYLERRAELALDCSPTARLIVDLDGRPIPSERLQAHYEAARTVRAAMEANGSFCRALLSLHYLDAASPLASRESMGGTDVPS